MSQSRGYFADDREFEEYRLVEQGKVLDPLTERLFKVAGLRSGMRVLDLGSGAGNVARLAARCVGPQGRVVGVERDADAVRRTNRLLADLPQAEFHEGDVQSLDGIEGPFDAVVGRLILMHLEDPVAALRRAASLVRPGGLICMHEPDLTHQWVNVETPLWRQARSWLLDACKAIGADATMGPSLFARFREAGLPDPEMTADAVVGGGSRAPAFGWADAVVAVLPALERLGVVSAREMEPETLTERLHAEITEAGGVVIGPLLYGAWTTV